MDSDDDTNSPDGSINSDDSQTPSGDTPDFDNILVKDTHLGEYLDKLDPEPNDFLQTYDPDCVQKLGNFASYDNVYSFESGPDHIPLTREILASISPKCLKMIEEIEKQDEEDLRVHGHRFKHFIYSGVKSSTKLLATALMDVLGLQLGYTSKYSAKTRKVDRNWSKIRILDNDELALNMYNNLYLLNSIDVYEQPINVSMRKELLKRFNTRPENAHGEQVRFIVMDSGFKEGIDLFDIKYVHIFEPQLTMADQKQVIGRGTRTCGQKGLDFHPLYGWPLFINIYDSEIPEEVRFGFDNAESVYALYMKTMGIDVRIINLKADMEKMYIEGAVDNELNESVHSFKLPTLGGGGGKYDDDYQHILKQMPLDRLVDILVNEQETIRLPQDHEGMRQYIRENYADYKWPDIVMENKCVGGGQQGVSQQGVTQQGVSQQGVSQQGVSQQGVSQQGVSQQGGAPLIFTPTQDFVRMYMTPKLDRKGMILVHSTGSGKTCSAIAAASSSFDEQGYTILWVTRSTLKADIWKNMFDQVCNDSIRTMVRFGVKIPDDQPGRMKLLSKAWAIRPMSYKQFSNMVSGKNSIYQQLVKRNGAVDPLRKTLVIIDEAHKLYGDSGMTTIEKPDMNAFYESVMKSYEVSGSESVRLLIMTATPITTSPMEFVKLLNLCRERHQKLEDEFETFMPYYLNEAGVFSPEGRRRFLDEISGYVSYLNREKDARSFAQPVIKHIRTPILNGPAYRSFDPRLMRELMKHNTEDMRRQLKVAMDTKEIMYGNIKKQSFDTLKDLCDNHGSTSHCEKLANKAVREILDYVKDKHDESKEKIKGIRENIREYNKSKKEILDKMKVENIKMANTDNYEKYKTSTFNAIKTKCKDPAKRIVFNNYPEVVRIRGEIDVIKGEMKDKLNGFKTMKTNMNKGIKELNKTMKAEKDPAKKQVIGELIRQRKAENNEKLIEINDDIKGYREMFNSEISKKEKHTRKLKSKLTKFYRKSLKNKAKISKAEINAFKKAQKEAGNHIKVFEDFTKIEAADLREVVQDKVREFNNEIAKKQAELDAKEKAKADKELEKQEKADAKAAAKAEREAKAVAKADAKAEREAKANKTRKNAK
jgi:hypothetical protein